MSNDQYSILLYKDIVCKALLDVSYLFNAAEQVSEEVERALAKLGSAKLTGRYQPFPPFPPVNGFQSSFVSIFLFRQF